MYHKARPKAMDVRVRGGIFDFIVIDVVYMCISLLLLLLLFLLLLLLLRGRGVWVGGGGGVFLFFVFVDVLGCFCSPPFRVGLLDF